MENSTLENGEERSVMAQGGILIRMEICMKGSGAMISALAKVLSPLKMEECIAENS